MSMECVSVTKVGKAKNVAYQNMNVKTHIAAGMANVWMAFAYVHRDTKAMLVVKVGCSK